MDVVAVLREDPDVVPKLAGACVPLAACITLSVVGDCDRIRERGKGGLKVREASYGARPRSTMCGVRCRLNRHPLVFGDDVDVDFPSCTRELLSSKACPTDAMSQSHRPCKRALNVRSLDAPPKRKSTSLPATVVAAREVPPRPGSGADARAFHSLLLTLNACSVASRPLTGQPAWMYMLSCANEA